MAWLFEAGEAGSFDCYDGADGWGHSDAAAHTRKPLKEAAKTFPALKAWGRGAWSNRAAEGETYSFALEGGILDWQAESTGV